MPNSKGETCGEMCLSQVIKILSANSDKAGVNIKSHESTHQKAIQSFNLIQREQWKVQSKIQFQNLSMAGSLAYGVSRIPS